MKRRAFFLCMLLFFAIEIITLILFAVKRDNVLQDAVAVNEAVQSVQSDWNTMDRHKNQTNLDYAVLDKNGKVIFRTKAGLSESINAGVIHRDTVLDIEVGGSEVGKIIIYNDGAERLQIQRQTVILILTAAVLFQSVICIGYFFYLNRTIVKPFCNLKEFAKRIAGGNLDIPLAMDRGNLFGAFTESFDIMRAELKKARIAEAEANASKKELVAKLSHDIKTPVSSIKAVSEVGAALTQDEKVRENYTQIIQKADQINTLITNLFTATLEELKQLPVTPSDMESCEIKAMLENADYLHRGRVPAIQKCMIYADKLRLQQVFDNIFANSYKYANSEIYVSAAVQGGYLTVAIEDSGGGVPEEELLLLKEKFKRGSNAAHIEGAGLGLYISDYFMKEMGGALLIENGETGLKATVVILLSGTDLRNI